MPLLFTLAGISTYYALQKRTPKQYIEERFFKLFIPLISGVLLLVPVQTFYAEKFHNAYEGGYFGQYILFFTKITDFSGYNGGFTPGQLWFIFYLFIISLVALPIFKTYEKSGKKLRLETKSITKLLPVFLITFMMSFVSDIGGKSFGEYFTLFLVGYFLLSSEAVLSRLDQNRWLLFITAIIFAVIHVTIFFYSPFDLLNDLFLKFTSWISILSILGMGRHYLNFNNKVTGYFSSASFPMYILHQSWIIFLAYYMLLYIHSTAKQFLLILTGGFLFTLLTYELLKRLKIARFLFGIRNKTIELVQFHHFNI